MIPTFGPVTQTLLTTDYRVADCGHITDMPYFFKERSYCCACLGRVMCTAEGCQQTGAYLDATGWWWCEQHQRHAVLLWLGAARLFPEMGPIAEGQGAWYLFVKACTDDEMLEKLIRSIEHYNVLPRSLEPLY